MKLNFFDQPEFLMAGIPVKDGSFNDHRIWIYHRLSLSLIELVYLDDITESDFVGEQKNFEYLRKDGVVERWKAVFVQNNCEATELKPDLVINRAWEYFLNYLIFEDGQNSQNQTFDN